MPLIPTPHYLLDERKLLRNLRIIRRVREASGARSVLALKCFSTWCVFDLMREYMDGTTSSGLYEARLGHAKFGGETHAYSVGYTRADIREVRRYADKIIFNSLSQLRALAPEARGCNLGVRVNPGFSYSHFDLADPARKYSRLGVRDGVALRKAAHWIRGLMFHFNCENEDFSNFARNLDRIGRTYGDLLAKLEWVSFGGGIFFTRPGYPLDAFCAKLRDFSRRHGVQVYLEPGESAITGAGELVTTVLDVVHNGIDVAIVDASTEAHMLDVLTYRMNTRLVAPAAPGRHKVMIAGRSCLAGDVFGTYALKAPLRPGRIVRFGDAAGYTMVKKNWFNGMPMPSIVVKRLNGKMDVVRKFGYRDFVKSLS
jgi:carboxynorspermidine decarboxylase